MARWYQDGYLTPDLKACLDNVPERLKKLASGKNGRRYLTSNICHYILKWILTMPKLTFFFRDAHEIDR